MKVLSLFLLMLVAGAPLLAQTALKGKPAPEFTAGESITSAPPAKTLGECKAEVVLIKLWGIN